VTENTGTDCCLRGALEAREVRSRSEEVDNEESDFVGVTRGGLLGELIRSGSRKAFFLGCFFNRDTNLMAKEEYFP